MQQEAPVMGSRHPARQMVMVTSIMAFSHPISVPICTGFMWQCSGGCGGDLCEKSPEAAPC